MQLISAIIPLLFASTLSALPVTNTKRSVSTVLSDLTSISSDVATLTNDATSYTGSLIQSLSLAATVDSLESAITTATSDTTSSGTFSSTDSDSILAAITTLTPKIVTLLSDLDAKASVVSSAGYTSTVSSALTKLTTDTDALFVALKAAVDSEDATSLATLQATIDTAFATASSTF